MDDILSTGSETKPREFISYLHVSVWDGEGRGERICDGEVAQCRLPQGAVVRIPIRTRRAVTEDTTLGQLLPLLNVTTDSSSV